MPYIRKLTEEEEKRLKTKAVSSNPLYADYLRGIGKLVPFAATKQKETPAESLPEPLPDVSPVDEAVTSADTGSASLPPDLKSTIDKAAKSTDNITEDVMSFDMPKPSLTKYREALASLENLRRQDPEGDWDSRLTEAKDLYTSTSDKNEWLDLAQRIGEGLTRLYAAREGQRAGVDLSGMKLADRVDYGAKTRGAREDFRDTVSDIEKSRSLAAQDATRAYQDNTERSKARLGVEKDIFGEDMTAYRQGQRDFELSKRETAREKKSEARTAKETASESFRALEKQVGDVDQELRAASARQKLVASAAGAFEKAAAQSKSEKRDAEIARAKSLLAQAGAEETQIDELLTTKDVPGKIWGTNEDYTQVAKALRTRELSSLGERIKELARMREQLRAKQLGTPEASAPAEQPASPTSPTEPSEDMVSEYVKRYPQVSKEQAKAILKGRLSGRK